MKTIQLTQGQVALVDDGDYEYLNQFKWCAHKNRSGNFYALRYSSVINGRGHRIHMSRQLLRLECGDKRQGDHINHNTLDNRQTNIRICTRQQNQMNRKPWQNSSSHFKGVSWCKRRKKWEVRMQLREKHIFLGYFEGEIDAALAYDLAAKKYHGEFAHLNFPNQIRSSVL